MNFIKYAHTINTRRYVNALVSGLFKKKVRCAMGYLCVVWKTNRTQLQAEKKTAMRMQRDCHFSFHEFRQCRTCNLAVCIFVCPFAFQLKIENNMPIRSSVFNSIRTSVTGSINRTYYQMLWTRKSVFERAKSNSNNTRTATAGYWRIRIRAERFPGSPRRL